jgi:hypothetical protein
MADENLGPVPDYKAEALRCRACQARDVAAAAFAGRDEPSPAAGLKFAVHRNGDN